MKTINVAGWNNNTGIGFNTNGSTADKNEKNPQVKNGAVFAGNINNMTNDRIEQKREQARKQAAKTLLDQFASDNKITDGLNEIRERNRQIQEEITGLQEEKEYFTEQQAALQQKYGVADDSQEQKDLELIQKANKAVKDGRLGDLSKEELEQIANMGELTEYQERVLAYDKILSDYDSRIEALDNERIGNTQSIISAKIDMVKNTGMLKAKDAAQSILDAASDSIIGMLMEEAKKHVDEEMEKLVEAAKKEAEKKEELEKQIEAVKEKNEEQEELVENIQESTSEQDKLKNEIDKILKEAELLEEEMKGILVDETL